MAIADLARRRMRTLDHGIKMAPFVGAERTVVLGSGRERRGERTMTEEGHLRWGRAPICTRPSSSRLFALGCWRCSACHSQSVFSCCCSLWLVVFIVVSYLLRRHVDVHVVASAHSARHEKKFAFYSSLRVPPYRRPKWRSSFCCDLQSLFVFLYMLALRAPDRGVSAWKVRTGRSVSNPSPKSMTSF